MSITTITVKMTKILMRRMTKNILRTMKITRVTKIAMTIGKMKMRRKTVEHGCAHLTT